MEGSNYNYDLFIIGGGPGGNSCAKEASKYGKKIGLADFVEPSPIGTVWGLGGTCVNVGCIPKKMMHYAGLKYDDLDKYKFFGYETSLKKEFNWETLVSNVNMHIASLNFGYRGQLRSNKVTYYNKYAKFIDQHTLELIDKKGNVEKITADKILIATGLRPYYPEISGAKECCITSDDIFKLKKEPGKTLIIGAGYIAVECASFLSSFGYDVSLMIRSKILREFDNDMSSRIENILIKSNIKCLMKCTPEKFYKENDKIICEYKDNINNTIKKETFDTIILAVGRKTTLQKMNIEKTNIKLAKSGKIIVDNFDKSNIDNIYAIGDISEGRPELAPPAIRAGKLLAKRLFTDSNETVDYENIATTIYAKIEYGCCGLSEEKAIEKYGKEFIKVYHSEFKPVEWTFDPENEDTCYLKVIVNIKDNNKVIGFHIFSPNAGEITQGISVAMKCGLTKDILDQTIGIHPTIAEEITTLDTTKDQGDGKKGGC